MVGILEGRSGLYLFHKVPKNNPISPKNIAIVTPVTTLKVLTTFIGISILSGFGGQVIYIVAISIKYSAGTIYEILFTLRNLKNITPIAIATTIDVI
jgi:hypothetical protein